jgi:single-stranded-DNA-specific exonuclease
LCLARPGSRGPTRHLRLRWGDAEEDVPRWVDPGLVTVPAALREAVGGHPLVAETLARRGMLRPEAASAFLDPALYSPAPPDDLPDLSGAVDRLRWSLERGERITIWGDFDADGQTATALLLEVLQSRGGDVTFHVPSRDEGHGVHVSGVDRLADGGTRLLITCDTGVTAQAAIAWAARRGVDVIVTDHHVLGDRLPAARAVVNPHRLPAGHPMETLTGVGVAYQVARALDQPLADRALDLVAVGSVADVATLTGDTRYLVQRGLEVLSHTERLGLQAMYEVADLRPEGITEEHIGFTLGPRLNALGRLADAAHGVELLTTDDRVRARTLAGEVEALNARRQWLTRQVTEAALAQIGREPELRDGYRALVLNHPTWPGGVVGIVAGRLAERYGKPAVLIAAPPGQLGRGSGRSVPGVNLVAALAECAPLLETFGGHAGAAGFAIKTERIPELRHALSRALAAQIKAVPEPTLQIDAYVELPGPEAVGENAMSAMPSLNLDLVHEINRLAPFGPGNPPLTLAVRNLRRTGAITLGRTDEHRRITVEDPSGRSATVFWWHGADWSLPDGTFDLALSARASDYRGMVDLQLEWIDARVVEPAVPEIVAPTVAVCDYRSVSNPEAALRRLAAQGVPVWAEVAAPADVAVLSRHQLPKAPGLAIWTLPPGRTELRAALDAVGPEQVYLFGTLPPHGAGPGGRERAEAFLTRLAGLVRYALHSARRGPVTLIDLAAATAEKESTVQAGLDWLAAQGQILPPEPDGDGLQLLPGTGATDPEAVALARARLDALLAESDAFREYLRTAPSDRIQVLAM